MTAVTVVEKLDNSIYQAPVVKTLDSAIHWVRMCPLDRAIGFPNTCPLDRDLSGG